MADDDDDDFEDLFSFGGGAAAPSPDPVGGRPPAPPAGSGSNGDRSGDASLSTTPGGATPTPAGGGGAARNPGRTLSAGSGGGDDFDDLFGTPPATPATPRTPLDGTPGDGDREALLAIDEAPAGASADDFHVHDEDTRDMLDWLDDDVPAGKKAAAPPAPKSKESAEDDFDFDEMIAESASGEASEGKGRRPPGAEAPPVSDENSLDPTEDGPVPPQLQGVPSSNIEEELALDQWEDDDDDGGDEDVEGTGDSGDDDEGGGEPSAGENEPPPAKGKRRPPSSPKAKFATLAEAVRSNASTVEHVRSLFKKERGPNDVGGHDVGVGEEDRAHLWAKVICGKVLKDVEDGSLADSYREWEKKADSSTDDDEGGECGAAIDALLKQASGGGDDVAVDDEEKRRLLSLCRFHGHRHGGEGAIDPLLPPVALAMLLAGFSPAAASVALSQIEPGAMPLLRLSGEERRLASKALHADFYLLACYHLPLLVMHLDRHCPGWYWPRKGSIVEDETPGIDGNDAVTNDDKKAGEGESGDNEESKAKAEEKAPSPGTVKSKNEEILSGAADKKLEENGLVPLSWFVTTFAGECGGSCLDHKHLLPLLDNVLTKGDHSWKYFLAIAVLGKNSDVLLMSRGEELKQGLEKILDFQETSFAEESFVGASEGGAADGDGMVSEWLLSAKSLVESTPSSVTELLRSADDRAVSGALQARQTQVEKELQAQLDAEEEARRKEREQRDAEAEMALNKARLTAYYRTYNPDKMETIPEILKLFDGRMGVLNEKLKIKYGKGFLPEEDLKDQTRSFLMSVNQSIAQTRKHVSVAVAERRKKNAKSAAGSCSKTTPVALEVSATEVIPIISTTKAHNLATGKKMTPVRRTSDTVEALQFYLVDCRPESIATEQGRFPTAVTLSPEKLQDPDELQKLTDMFESLRGAVHICVMGEGFASFPVLYNHTLSEVEQKLLQDDLARTSDCALFFLKKGFPFVSVLRGGFAAAHAFLSRNGLPMVMSPLEVLIDYDPDVSLFAQLETARQEEEEYKNAPARDKTVRTLQKIIDNSMTRLTLEEQRINSLANDLAKPETVVKMKQSVSNFLAKPKPSMSFGRTPPLFMSKKFASSPTNKEKESEKKTESTQEDEKAKSAAAIVKEKIHLKMASLPSDISNDESGVDENDKDIATEPEASPELGATSNYSKAADPAREHTVGSKMSFASFTNRMKQVSTTEGPRETDDPTPGISPGPTSSSDKDNDKSVASDKASKVSSAFASLTQRIQQSTSTGNPAGDKKESTGNISISDFTNRMKLGQPSGDQTTIPMDEATEGEVSEEKEDSTTEESGKKEVETNDSTHKPADGSRFTKFTISFGGTLAGLKEKAADAKVEEAKDSVPDKSNDEEPKAEKSKFKPTDDGGRFNKFTKSFGGTLAGLRETATNAEIPEGKKDSAPEKSESKENETKINDFTEKPTDGGRFTKFTKSFEGALSGLREAADAKVSEKKEASIPTKTDDEEVKTVTSMENPSDGGRFSKLTKSFGSSLASKLDSIDLKKSSEGEESEPGLMTRRISELGKSSMGKLLFENDPLPKTRFQRIEEEESISFNDGSDEEKSPSTDDLREDSFADVSLTDISLSDGGKEEATAIEEKPDEVKENLNAL